MNRVRIIHVFFTIYIIAIVFRLIYWQIYRHVDLKRQAEAQHFTSLPIGSSRGQILSRDGVPLVTNYDTYQLILNPLQFPRDLNSANLLADSLISSGSAKSTIIKGQASGYQWWKIASGLSVEEKHKIEALKMPGIILEAESSRAYPQGTSSAQLLGFVGRDDLGRSKGYFGLEGYYDLELSGKPGQLVRERDAFNRPIAIGVQERISAQSGRTIHTSIDRTVQHVVFTSLLRGLEKYHAESGTVSVMDPKTGQVLGMVSLPGYDPSEFSKYTFEAYTNPIIASAYEPGSTFKVIVMASALDANLVTSNTICIICSGPVTIGDAQIKSWDGKYYPNSSIADIILHSDNVGMVFVARKLGKERLLQYVRRFGFGSPTGIDLQGEASPELRSSEQWHEIDWSTASFGQGIAVTPIQMLRAVSAIANLGQMPFPHLVTKIDQKVITHSKSVSVISSRAAAQITQMMINGVEKGEVRYHKPSGYLIAGKTGTAQIPISGHYDPNKVIASFIGFAPADNPRFVMLVTLKDPKPSQWGSTTAAPIWFDIASQLFRYYGIPPKSVSSL